METPSEAVKQDGTMSGTSEAGMNYVDQEGFGKSTKGVFDATGFKAPAQAPWPRVYP
jgi:hypothetical protein